MSKKFRSQASSARAASALTGGFGSGSTFQTSLSPLSYVTELPDLSQISEANLVVALKNLGKKDSTTKAKALEELQENCNRGIEHGILQAWAEIYPRTSIDNSRRVRQLAHTLQGSLTVSAGKRIAPLLPKVIGSWLAGTFDSDKSVARSAQDALEKSFTTPEKRNALWKLYQDALLHYVEDAVTVQKVGTLSDERTTSADDAQTKYVRVVGTALNILTQLLEDGVQSDLVNTLLSGKQLWEFVYHDDSYLRRTVCELMITALEKYIDQLDWVTISTCFLSKGLHSNQSGSTRQYTSALLALTRHRPQIWTSDYTAKTAVSKRLIQFLSKGSQNGPEIVWSNIASLTRSIPEEVWLGDKELESATKLMDSLRSGVTQPSERVNAAAAWTTYAQTCLWLTKRLQSNRTELANQFLIPIVKQYVTRQEDRGWTIGSRAVEICRGVLTGIVKQEMTDVFDNVWTDMAQAIMDAMKLSQPESSKDFKISQESVIDQAKRLYEMKAGVTKAGTSSSITSILEREDAKLLDAAIELLWNRNGKPYSAAGIVEIIVNQSGYDKHNANLQSLLNGDVSVLFHSPSSEKLASVALACKRSDIAGSLLVRRSAYSDIALRYMLVHMKNADFNHDITRFILSLNMSDASDRQIMAAAMQNPTLSEVHSIMCHKIQESTSADASLNSQQAGLGLLEILLANPASANIVKSEEYRPSILSNLLVIADTGNELSENINPLIAKMKSFGNSGSDSTFIIQQQLQGEGVPLSIFTLIDLATSVAQTKDGDLAGIIPTQAMWEKALEPHLLSPRPYSLIITSPLQGLLYEVTAATTLDNKSNVRDQDDFTLVFRLVLYVTKILTSEFAFKFNNEQLQPLYLSYPLALQLVNEKLTMDDANDIWIRTTPEVLHEAADTLSDGNMLIQSWLSSQVFTSLWIKLAHSFVEFNMRTYITGMAWCYISSSIIDQAGPTHILQEYEKELKTAIKSEYFWQNAVVLAVSKEYLITSARGNKILNELVAKITDTKEVDTRLLILLNILLQGNADCLDAIPTRRLVFLMTALIHLLDDRNTEGIMSEAMKLLTAVLPHVSEIYGNHWEQILTHINRVWSADMDLPLMNSSVRLYASIQNLARADDVNEDLQDAWKQAAPELDAGLLDCLRVLSQTIRGANQPRSITAELVRRQLRGVKLESGDDIFALLSSPVDAVQTAAFELLHRAIPEQQEQLSIDLLLEQKSVQLPLDLISLLSAHHTDSRRYLLAWKLVFDHFSKASYKLREAYTTNLKESGMIDDFLNHVCESLSIVGGRAIDASKFDIANFDLAQTESEEKEIQWLTIHNYYNALLYTPSLTKEWFIAQKNRIKSPLELWTQKYISPMIVAASLSTVTEWASTQSQDEDSKALAVKSSPQGSEITATITVDPESPPISLAISLPSTYPLDSPVVISRLRVGVSEKNWQSWLRTIQIIIFSTGSIIEGLVAFRKNVQGALKGQSECAICYSIIGTDMQTPTKKCGTCKNMFHGTCLFRWFKSSNSSSCPLCRNNFNYA